MSISIEKGVEIAPYTTFRMGGRAQFFCEIISKDALVEYAAFAAGENLPLLVLGGGSNVILPDQGMLLACIALIKILGFEVLEEKNAEVTLKIGAGQEWDSVVAHTVELGLCGIEAMSAIPGSTGATPIQNVGAYGQEIADTLQSVEVYDLETHVFKTLTKEECQFTYRDSKFKREWKGKYVIVAIVLTLLRTAPTTPLYPGVEEYFKKKGILKPTLRGIREAIIDIRSKKLPDPKVVASCGSFFKNPHVTKEIADALKARYPKAVVYELPSGMYKVGAGWLIDMLGLKGKKFGALEIYEHNALVLVNKGGATREELEGVVADITGAVKKEFDIALEVEPIFVDPAPVI